MMKRKRLLLLLLMALIAPLAMHAQKALPYSYGFENNDLASEGWILSATSSNTGIYNDASTAYEGSYLFRFYYSERNAYLVSPLLTGTDNGVDVSFYYVNYSSNYTETFQVGYTTDASVTDPTAFTYGAEISGGNSWDLYKKTFPAGTKRVAIKYVYTDAYYLYLDNFTFTAPDLCGAPSGLSSSNVTASSADLAWDGLQDTYTVRYREAAYINDYTFFEDFENGLDNWTIYTEGEAPQTAGWYQYDPSQGLSWTGHNGSTYVASAWSWSGDSYEADNWLVSPQVELGGTLRFYVYTNQNYPDDYAVLLSTSGNEIDDFTVTLQEMAPAPTTGDWVEVNIDLSAYQGQNGYIAIHHDFYDGNYLLIDDFGIGTVIPAGSWNTVTARGNTTTINGLDSETNYEWQVQGDCDNGTTEWSESAFFQTLSNCAAPMALSATDITANSATLNWTGVQNSFNVRYRTAEAWETFYFTNFNTANDRDGWTWTDQYYIYGYDDPILDIPADENYFLTMGWSSTEEEYIISPELPEYPSGSKVEFYHFRNSFANTFQVGYSSTTNDLDAFTWSDPIDAGQGYTLYSEMLAAGIKYVAFKATAASNYYAVFIDNFGIYGNQVPAGSWNDVTVNTTTLDISHLAASTEYEWQVQGVNASCDGGLTEWSAMATFTTEPSCLVPTDLDYEFEEGIAVLSWTSDATLFDIEVNEQVITGVTNPYNLVVEPETIYEVRVRANCGNNDYSDWTEYIAFVTECNEPKDLPYTFGFDIDAIGEYYACWMAGSYNDENDVTLAYDPDDNTNIAFRFSSIDNADDYTQYLISPELNTESDIAFSFDYRSYTYGTETFQVGYASDDFEFTWSEEISASGAEWTSYNEVLPAGTKYVAILYTSDYQYYLWVDNFMFEESTNSVTQTLELVGGWNWFSTYIEIDPVELIEMMEEQLGEDAIQIKSQTQATAWDEDEEEWSGRLQNTGLTSDKTYMIQMVEGASVTVTLVGPASTPDSYTIAINKGWNWIGFPSAEPMDVNEALAGFNAIDGDELKTRTQATAWDEDEEEWSGRLNTLIPGQGFLFKSASEEVRYLNYNTGSSKRKVATHNGNAFRNKLLNCKSKINTNPLRINKSLNKTKKEKVELQKRSIRLNKSLNVVLKKKAN